MPVDEKVVSPDEYVVCRGVPVPKEYISEKEEEYDAKMIEDPNTQETLDENLARFRIQATSNRKEFNPKGNMFQSKEGYYFFADYVFPLGLYFPGLPMLNPKNHPRPIWFFKPKSTSFGGSSWQ